MRPLLISIHILSGTRAKPIQGHTPTRNWPDERNPSPVMLDIVICTLREGEHMRRL